MFPKVYVYLFLFLLGNSLFGESEVNYGYLKENESIQIKAGEILSIVGYSADSKSAHAFMLTLDDESDVFFPVAALGNELAMSVMDGSGKVSASDLVDLATEAALKKGLLKTHFERIKDNASGEYRYLRYENGRVTGKYTEKQIRKSLGENNVNAQMIVGPCVLKNKMTYLSYKKVSRSTQSR
jgi:hypothetical protein